MKLSLLSPLWPHVRSCGSRGRPAPPPSWIIVFTVALYTALAVRGEDLATVAGYSAALTASALLLIALAYPRVATAAPAGRGDRG